MNRVQKSERENDQAGELRSRIERHKAKSLPKRSKVHKKKKSKVKFKFPIIQALALFFILLPIGFYNLYTYLQKLPDQDPKPNTIVVDNSKDEKEAIPTTATANDLKGKDDKESPKSEAMIEKEEAKAKAEAEEQKAEEQEQAKKKAEKAKAQQEAEEKAKAKREAEEKARAQQLADEKAKQEAAEKKKAAQNVQAAKPDSDEYKVLLHTVKAQETLFRISMNYYKSQEGIALIREWNGLNGNEISNGQVLKIPIKK
ncbi:LysM peptidoglycan-binding domain-containing protein [Peribacillus muralis]|uniref:LysM peptidoglycan-binding domain-containing protein n=1 Tax=Peribacillus muralis TaxID=264697 RepID=UPI00070D08F5|nr:LysM peptidoglycan-binding domain-containing protein [Peribacillus muralis]